MQLKIGTYNIQHGVLHQKRLDTGEVTVDLAPMVAVLKQHAPDVCTINEIYGDGNFGDQPKALGEALGYHYHFAPAIDHRYGKYGIALLSRYPITKVTTIPLHVKEEDRLAGIKYEDRVLMIAELLVEDQPFTVMLSHFGLAEDEQALAIDTVIREGGRINTPLALLGDFNLTPDTPAYARLAAVFLDSATLTSDPMLTFPSHKPNRKIDYVFVGGGAKPTRVEAPAVVASDHLPIFAEVTL